LPREPLWVGCSTGTGDRTDRGPFSDALAPRAAEPEVPEPGPLGEGIFRIRELPLTDVGVLVALRDGVREGEVDMIDVLVPHRASFSLARHSPIQNLYACTHYIFYISYLALSS
jgi:hypothetical protein